MKRYKIAWLVIVTVWSNVLGLFLLFSVVTGEGARFAGPEDVLAICLFGFTLPAAALYLLFAAIAWLTRRVAHRRARRPSRPSRMTRLLGRARRRSLVHTNPA